MTSLCVDSTTSDGSVSCGAVQLPSLFSLMSSKPTFLDQHLGETLVYFLQLFFLFLAFIPNILLLKLFHKLLPAKMYLSGRCEILSEHGGHKAHSLD